MINLDISTIEAMPKEDIANLKSTAYILHQETDIVLNTPMSAQDIEREQELREFLVIKISESINYLDAQIEDLKAIQKDLRIVKGYQQTDKRRLENYRFSVLISEKALRQRP